MRTGSVSPVGIRLPGCAGDWEASAGIDDPIGLSPAELGGMLARADRPAGFEVVLSARRPLDPIGREDDVEGALHGLADAGAMSVGAQLAARAVDHYCEQLYALKNRADVLEEPR